MRQPTFDRPGHVRWEDTEAPTITHRGMAIVRSVAVAACDLDTAIRRGQVPRFEGPYPFGHEGIAEVVEVGEDVRTVVVGDLVAVPFQISCGACVRCRSDHPSHCERYHDPNDYGLGPTAGGWPGLLADRCHTPTAACASPGRRIPNRGSVDQ